MYRNVEAPASGAAGRSRRARVRSARRRLGAIMRSPWTPAVLILLVYGWWLLLAFRSGHEARDFIVIGRQFVRQGHASTVIKLDPRYHYVAGGTGYDGQFAYFIALDPIHARDYLDTRSPGSAGPDYRYTRILYPMLARLLAWGQPDAIPYTLLAINWLALAFGTLVVAAWLRRKRLSPWFSLLYGLYPGLFVALQRDLNEALAFALVALAVYLYEPSDRRATVGAAVSFALASLARETTLVFPLVYAFGIWNSRGRPTTAQPTARARTAWVFAAISFGPFLLWKLFLWHWLGSVGRSGGVYPQPVPLGGLLSYWPWGSDGVEQAVAVVLPAIVLLGICVRMLPRQWRRPELWALLLNVLLFVVFLNPKSYVEYYASGRVATGVVLAALYCLPLFGAAGRGTRWGIWLCALLWLSLLPALSSLPRRAVQPTDAAIDLGIVALVWMLTRFTGLRVEPSLPSKKPRVYS